MFFRKCALILCIVLSLAAIAQPKSVQAQETPYVPSFARISQDAVVAENTQACVTVEPIPPTTGELVTLQFRDNMLWVPSARKGPQCKPRPNGIDNAIGLKGSSEVLTPVALEEVIFQAIGGVQSQSLPYQLNPEIAYTVFEEAMSGNTSGYFDELIGVWYLGSEEVSAADTNLIPPNPFGGDPFYLVRLHVASELYTNGTFLHLDPETVMYKCPSETCDHLSLGALCPGLPNDFAVIYLGSFSAPKVLGAVSVMEMWTLIGHTPRSLNVCPATAGYNYLNGPDTWYAFEEEIRSDTEMVVENQKEWLQRNIELLPQGAGNPILAPASFDSVSAGDISLIGIAIVVGGIIIKFIAAARGMPIP